MSKVGVKCHQPLCSNITRVTFALVSNKFLVSIWGQLNLDFIVHITISILGKAVQQVSRWFQTFPHFPVFFWALQTIPISASYPVPKLLPCFRVSFQQCSTLLVPIYCISLFSLANKDISEAGKKKRFNWTYNFTWLGKPHIDGGR